MASPRAGSRPIRKSGAPRQAGKPARRLAGLLVLSVVIAALLCALSMTAPFRLLELRGFDYLSTMSVPVLPADGPIIVAIDEPSMADISSQWPWPRALHAQLVEALRRAGAKVIGFDVIFAEPSAVPENDSALAKVLGPDVVLAGDEMLIRTPQADQLVRTEPLPIFIARGAHTGIASVGLSGDGILRTVPGYPDGFAQRLAAAAGLSTVPPADGSLLQTFGPARTYPTVSYYQALHPEQFLPPDIFKGRIVIIGLSLQNAPTLQAGGADTFATSFTVHSQHLVAGAEIQATIFDNIVHGLAIRQVDRTAVMIAIALASVLACVVAYRTTGWSTVGVALVVMPGLVFASYAALRWGAVFVSPLGPALAFFGTIAGQTIFDYAAERRSRKDIIRAFSRYLSPALVERLADNPASLKLGGERRTLSILFCDVRGFTTISERLKDDPEQLTTLINRLLTPLSDIVLESGGTIDKYIGDCLMAFWNAPLDDPDHAVHAVGAALDMLEAIEALNNELKVEADAAGSVPHSLRIGIGINTGDGVVGNMGSSRRFDYSVLGDAVNLASRLEGESKNYNVPLLIGERTATMVGETYTVVELDTIAVKGRTERSPIFAVVEAATVGALARHRAFLDRKYAGTLTGEDSVFVRGGNDIPQLSAYYARMANQIR